MNIKQLLIATILLLSSGAYGQSDFDEAKLLAEQGDAEAQLNLGIRYANGEGVPEDDVEAVKWYRLAAKQGLARGQSYLGIMYGNGDGVPENYAEAVKWFRLAAVQGYACSQYNFGLIYHYGLGDADAQSNLGIMHANGDGVPRSNVRAYIWWSVAAAQGQEDAKRNRGLVTERLTTDQLIQAQQIATRCIKSDYQDCE